MRLKKAAALAGIWLAGCGAAMGQTVDSGTEVTVNPVLGGGKVVLYPGGDYMRLRPNALMPGETVKDLGPIHLHMPTRHRVIVRKAADTPRAAEAAPAPEPPKPTRKAAPRQAVAKASPPSTAPAAPQSGYNPNDFGISGAAGLNLGGSAAPAPSRTASANPPPANVTSPPPAEGQTPGLSKRSVILFAPEAADPAEAALGAIKFLAGDLNAAMTRSAARVQLLAYGGKPGDKGSDARRLSLKRALAIRQALIDDGVSADRIDVRAMGGVDDKGPADRVDVFVKS